MKISKYYLFFIVNSIAIFIAGLFIQKENRCLSKLNMLRWSVYCSRGAGLVLAVFMPLLVMTTCKYTLTFLHNNIKFVRKYLTEHILKIHKIVACLIGLNVIIHVVSHYVNFYNAKFLNLAETSYIHHHTFAGVSGHIMTPFMILLFANVIPYIRKKYYEIFFFTHNFYIIIYSAFMFHSFGCFVKTNDGKCAPYYSVILFGVPLIIYSCEKYYDLFFKKKSRVLSVEFKKDLCKINFTKPFKYKAGQYIKILIPEVDKFVQHPYTITSCPRDKYMSIAIKECGDWSKNVVKFLHQMRWDFVEEKSVIPVTNMYITGPFSSPCDSVFDYTNVIFISTGIGITPFVSILKEIKQRYITKTLTINKINCVIINNDNDNYEWFDEIIRDCYMTIPETILKFDIFSTEKFLMEEISIINNLELHNMTFFKGTDIPINYGRPDFLDVFNNHIEKTKKHVGVFSCSNESTNKNILNVIDKLNNKLTKFKLIKEPFY